MPNTMRISNVTENNKNMVSGRLTVNYNHREYVVPYSELSKVNWLKQHLSSIINLATNDMCIVINGEIAVDSQTLVDAKVSNNSKIDAFRKLKERIVSVRYNAQVREYLVCDSCTLRLIIKEILKEENISADETDNYFMTQDGAILSSSTSIKKLHVDRSDVLDLFRGSTMVHRINSTQPDSPIAPVHFRSSIRTTATIVDAAPTTDMTSSVSVDSKVMDELVELKKQVEELRSERMSMATSDMTVIRDSLSVGQQSADDFVTDSTVDTISRSQHTDGNAMSIKINMLETSLQETVHDMRRSFSEAGADLQQVKQTVSNITKATVSSADNGSISGITFSALYVQQLAAQVESLQRIVGLVGGPSDQPLVDQMSSVTTRMQSLQRDLSQLRIGNEDLDDRVESLGRTIVSLKKNTSLTRSASGSGSPNIHDDRTDESDNSLVSKLLDMKGDLIDAKRDMEAKVRTNEEQLVTKMREVTETVDSIQTKVDGIVHDNGMQRSKTVQMDSRIGRLEEQVSHGSMMALQQGLTSLSGEMVQVRQNYTGIVETMQKEKQATQERVGEIDTQVKTVQKVAARNKRSVTELQEVVTALASTTKNEMDGLRQMCDGVVGSVSTLTETVNTIRTDTDNVKSLLADTSALSAAAMSKATSVEETSASAIQSLTTTADETSRTAATIQEDITSVRCSIVEVSQSVEGMRHTTDLLQETCNDLRSESTTAFTSAQEIVSSCATTAQLLTVEDRLQAVCDEVEKTKKGVESVRAVATGVSDTLHDLGSRVDSIESTVTTLQETEKTVKASASSLSALEAEVAASKMSLLSLITETKNAAVDATSMSATAMESADSAMAAVTALSNHREDEETMTQSDMCRQMVSLGAQVKRVQEALDRAITDQSLLRQSIVKGDDATVLQVKQIHNEMERLLRQTRDEMKQLVDTAQMEVTQIRQELTVHVSASDASESHSIRMSARESSDTRSTDIRLKIATLESRIQSLRSSSQDTISLSSDVAELHVMITTLQTALSKLESDNGRISAEMVVLREDWDGRQQALLDEMSLVKTTFDKIFDKTGEDDVSASSNGSKPLNIFKKGKKKMDCTLISASMEVLREDEKSLKERVVINSESCSDRYVRLCQQIEVLRSLIVQEQQKQENVSRHATEKLQAETKAITEDMSNWRIEEHDLLKSMVKDMGQLNNSTVVDSKSEDDSCVWESDVKRLVDSANQRIISDVNDALKGNTDAIDGVKALLSSDMTILRGEIDLAVSSLRSEMLAILNMMVESLKSSDPETVCTVEYLIEKCKIPDCFEHLKTLQDRICEIEQQVVAKL